MGKVEVFKDFGLKISSDLKSPKSITSFQIIFSTQFIETPFLVREIPKTIEKQPENIICIGHCENNI